MKVAYLYVKSTNTNRDTDTAKERPELNYTYPGVEYGKGGNTFFFFF